jgi:FG-GAP-like repeat
MVGIPLGIVDVYGTGFFPGAQVLIDGIPASTSSPNSATQIEVFVPLAFGNAAAVHAFTVVQGSETSNPAALTVYEPAQGPQPFNAPSGYFPGSANSNLMAVCDLNGDGFADVVVAGQTIDSIVVMFGQANGQLSPPTTTSGLFAGPMVCGDVDGDGHPDIVTATNDANSSQVISVLLNDGKGNFRQGPTVPFTGDFPTSMTLADMTGSGRLDLLFIVHRSLLYLKNQGGGTFASPVTLATPPATNPYLAVADFNEDGKPDIAYAYTNPATNQDELHLLLNQGNGLFSDVAAPGILGEAGYFVVGDFNNDGHLDVAMQLQPSFYSFPVITLRVFLGRGDGTFAAGPTSVVEVNGFQTFQLVAGDFDHDGFLDIAAQNGDSGPAHIVMLWGNGTGHFSRQQINGPQGFSLTTADVNGDGLPDILIPDRFGIISVVLGENNRNFPSASSFTTNFSWPQSAGDVTGQHHVDLLSPGSETPPNQPGALQGALFLNDGSGNFSQGGYPPGQGFVLADLNGDGFADLIGSDGTNLLIWPGTGDPSFASSSPIVISPPPNGGFFAPKLQVADMDGDGRLDLVMPNVVLYNNGNFSFTAVPVAFCYTSSPFVIADFNHDGLLDIAMGTCTLLGQANRTFREVPNNLSLGNGNYAAVGDFNQDGYPDIVYGGNGYPLVVLYGRGDGTFYVQSELSVGPEDFSESIVVADVNGDGRPDIIACLFFSEQCAVYTNDGQGGFQRSYFASGANSINLLAANLKGDGTPGLVISNYLVVYSPPNFLVVLEK